jgi:hypothetical protein
MYPHSHMKFPVPVIPCLCFMTHIHRGIEDLFDAGCLAGTSISSVSGSSLESHVCAASRSWMKLYMFPLTFDESFSPCIHNGHGSSQRSVDVTSVPAPSSFFQKALAFVSKGDCQFFVREQEAKRKHQYDDIYGSNKLSGTVDLFDHKYYKYVMENKRSQLK